MPAWACVSCNAMFGKKYITQELSMDLTLME